MTSRGPVRPWHLTCFLSWLRVTRAGQGLDGAGAARLGDAEAAAVTTPAAAMAASTEDDPLPKDPVDNAQQFFGWFASVEASMERGREDVYRYVFDHGPRRRTSRLLPLIPRSAPLPCRHECRSHLEDLKSYRKVCDTLHEQIERTLLKLQTMQTSYLSVADRSRSLQDACERLLEQQTHLASLAESVGDRLSFFNELEGIARLFNTPGEVVVLHERFLPSLNRLDQCLAYIDANVRWTRTLSTRAPVGWDTHRGRGRGRGGWIGRVTLCSRHIRTPSCTE